MTTRETIKPTTKHHDGKGWQGYAHIETIQHGIKSTSVVPVTGLYDSKNEAYKAAETVIKEKGA